MDLIKIKSKRAKNVLVFIKKKHFHQSMKFAHLTWSVPHVRIVLSSICQKIAFNQEYLNNKS